MKEELSFIVSKLQRNMENLHLMDEKERTDLLYFVLNVQRNQIERLLDVTNNVQDTNENLIFENDELREKVQFYQKFIQDSNLNKRYEFYQRTKGVI